MRLLLPPLLALALTTCEPFTQPTTTTDIRLSFLGDSVLVAGDTILPSIDVTADGVTLEQPRLRYISSDPTIIAVTSTGTHLAALKRGAVTITVELIGSTVAEPPTEQRVFTVHAEGVRTSRSAVTLHSLGDTVTVGAAVLTKQNDSIPNEHPDSWVSSDPTKATVDARTGRITAVANGSVQVRAIVDDDTTSVTVTVQQVLAHHTFSPTTLLLQSLGDTARVTATPRDTGGSVIPDALAPQRTWESANGSVVTVSTAGTVTAVTNGSTYIRALSNSGAVKDSIAVQVVQLASRVTINLRDTVTIEALEDTLALTATGFDALNRVLLNKVPVWEAVDPSVLVITPPTGTGIARPLKVGTTRVTSTVDAAKDTIVIRVTNDPRFVLISPDSAILTSLNDSSQLSASVRNKNMVALPGIPVTWRVLDTSVVRVDTLTGLIVARAPGSTRAVVAVSPTITDTIRVVVNNLAASVSIVPAAVTLPSIGDSVVPDAVIRNARGDAVSRRSLLWRTDDQNVATVNADGTIFAQRAGRTVVHAKVPQDTTLEDAVDVIVTNAPEVVTLNRTTDTLRALSRTMQYEASAQNANGALIAGFTPQWRSLDPSVASVSASGLATALREGTTRIVAETGAEATLRADTAVLVVRNEAVSMSLSLTSATISSVGDSVQLGASARNDVGGEVTGVTFVWSSSDTAIATVSSVGLVKGRRVGTVTVTAQLNTLSASATIEVQNAPFTVAIAPTDVALASIGDTVIPTVDLRNLVGDPLARSAASWSSDDPLIATVSSSGAIVAVARGATTVRARNPLNAIYRDSVAVVVTQTVAAVDVDRTSDVLPSLNRTLTYSAVSYNARGAVITDQVVTFTSRNPAIATVTPSGGTSAIVTSVGIGQVYIVGTAGTKSDSALLTVSNTSAALGLSPSSLTLTSVDDQATVTATPRNELGNAIPGATVTWTTSNTAVATVSAAGVVKAIGVGTALVSAQVDATVSSLAVTVTNHPATIDITPTTVTLANAGETSTPAAIIRNGRGTDLSRDAATWTTSNSAVATVSSNGVVTAVAAGTARITATSPASAAVTDYVDVTVTNAPASVTLSAASATLTAVGRTVDLDAVVKNAAGSLLAGATVAWASDATGVATVDANGVVTAVAAGAANISATSGSATASAAITVTNYAVSLAVTPGNDSILDLTGTSHTLQLTAVARNDLSAVLSGSAVTWSSNATGVATVSTSGLVTAVAPGVATITATVPNGATSTIAATALVSVFNAPRTLATWPATMALRAVGVTASIPDSGAVIRNQAGTALPATAVTWTTSAPSVATVTNAGVVTSAGVGTATITATSPNDGALTATTTVTVTDVATSVTLNLTSVTLTAIGRTQTLSAVVKNAAGFTITGAPVTWSSNATGVATVDASGIVTAASAGSATITATSGSASATSSVTVTNPATAVEVSPTSLAIASVGGTADVTVTARNGLGSAIAGQVVNLGVSPSGIATLPAASVTTGATSATFTVTGAGTGSATITLTAGAVSTSLGLTVDNPPTSIDITTTGAALTLASAGDQVQLAATIKNAALQSLALNTVTWTSSDVNVATVSAGGLVTAVGAGTARITATSPANATVSDYVDVTVTSAPASVTLNNSAVTLTAIGRTADLDAVVRNAAGGLLANAAVSWSSNATGVATVNANGIVTAVGVGNATITATSGTISTTAAITVTNYAVSLSVTPTADSILDLGGTLQLSAVARNNLNDIIGGVTWSSGTTSVATVNASSGLVTATSTAANIGTTTITASVASGASTTITATTAISVFDAPRTIIVPASASLIQGATYNVASASTIRDLGGTALAAGTVTWASSATGVATVDASGVVTAVGPGTTSISARSPHDASLKDEMVLTVTRRLAFTTQPTNVVVGSAISPAVVVTIQDNGGNTVTGSTENVTIAITGGSGAAGASLTGTVTVAAVAGVATFSNLLIDKFGSGYTLTAGGTSLTSATSTAFAVTTGTANQLALTTSAAGAASGSAFTTQPVVTIRDAAGNTVTSDNSTVITMTVSGGDTPGSAAGTVTATAVAGMATFVNVGLSGKAGSTTPYTLTFGDGTRSTTQTITPTVGTATQLVLTTAAAGAASGVAFTTQPVVAVRDAYGNTRTGDNSTVVTMSVSTEATPYGTVTRAAASGVASFAGAGISGAAGTGYTLTYSATSLTSATQTITPTFGAPAKLTLTTAAAGATSGAAFATQPVVAVQDAYGNTVTDFAATDVTMTVSGSGSPATYGTATAPTSSGVATFTSVGISGATGTSYTLTFDEPGSLTQATQTITPGSGSANRLVLTTTAAGAVSGAAFTTQPVIAIRDAAGNMVTSDNSTVVTMAVSGDGTRVGSYTATAVGGVASFTNVGIHGSTSTSYTLTFTSSPALTQTTQSITPTAGAATRLVLTTAAAGAASGAAFSTPPVVAVRDAYGNTITDDGSTIVTLSVSTGAATVGTVTKTAVSGVADFAGTSVGISGAAGTAYTLTYSAIGTGLTAATQAITPTYGAASKLTLTRQAAGASSGASFLTQPVVAVQDAYGNTVTNAAGPTYDVTMAVSAGASRVGTYSMTSVAATGLATFTDVGLSGANGTTYTLTFTSSPVLTQTTQSVTVSAGTPSQLVLTTAAAGAASGAAFTTQPVVAIRDAAGNTITSDNSTVVTMTVSVGASVVGTATATAVTGVATFVNVGVSGHAGTSYTLTFDEPGTLTQATQSIVPTVGSPSQLVFTQQPTNVIAAAAVSPAVTVEVRDTYGNVATGASGTVALSLTTPDGATLTGGGATSVASGVATFSNLKVNRAGTYTLSPTTTVTGATTLPASNSFTVSGSPVTSTVTPGSSSLTVDGAPTTTLTVQLKDASNNNLTTSGGTVTFVAIPADSGSIGAVTDNGNGTYTATYTAGTKAGSVRIRPILNGTDFTGFATITLTPGAASATTSTVTPTVSSLSTDGGSTTLTVQLKDQYGNSLTASGGTVTYVSIPGDSGTIGAVTPVGNGTYTATYTAGTKAGDVRIRPKLDGTNFTNYTTITLTPGAATQLIFTQQPPDSVVAAAAFAPAVTVAVKDVNGNTVTSAPGTISLALTVPGGATLSGGDAASLSSGVATFAALKVDKLGTYTLTPSYSEGGVTTPASSSVKIIASVSMSTVTAVPTSITANGSSTSTLTVQLKDADGNNVTVSGGTVTFLAPSTGFIGAVTDNANGTYTATYTSSTTLTTVTITAKLNGAAIANTATITLTP